MTTDSQITESTCTCATDSRIDALEARMTRRIDNLYLIISGGLIAAAVVMLLW